MNLSIPELCCELRFEEGYSYELIIENQEAFRKFLGWISSKNGNGQVGIILTEDEKELSILKYCEVIWNPFLLEFDNKKFISALFSEMKETCSSMYIEETANLNSEIIRYLDQIIENIPYNVDYSCELDVGGLFKLLNVKISHSEDSVVENLVEYIKLVKRILGISFVILIGPKQYLYDYEYQELQKSAIYEGIFLLSVSSGDNYTIKSERRFLIDKDLCFVDLN